MSEANIRALIVDSMLEMDKTGTYLSVEESAVLDKYDHLDRRDKAFYKKVMDGSCERRITIDHILNLYSKTPVNKMKPLIRAILRMSVYQLLWTDSMPDHTVCNEAVKLTSARGLSGLKGYVNGVLRTVSREKNNIRYPKKEDDPVRYLSVMYSCPEWIVRMFVSEYGIDVTERILDAYLADRELSVRLRTDSKESPAGKDTEKLERSWREAGIVVSHNPHIADARLLTYAGAVPGLAGYADGRIYIQDTGSMMVAGMAGIRAGDVIMDLCAAPGSKCIHASDVLCKLGTADTSGQSGHVYAYDISESRCGMIRDNIARLGLDDMITVTPHDATSFIPEMEKRADIVIADVPCSGLGVIGHKSDIKYRIQPEDIDSLADVQRQIADVAVRYVRPGGKLIYSTCTLGSTENRDQARYIINKYGFSDITGEALASSDIIPPDRFDAAAMEGPGLQVLPGIWHSDGFYICVLRCDG